MIYELYYNNSTPLFTDFVAYKILIPKCNVAPSGDLWTQKAEIDAQQKTITWKALFQRAREEETLHVDKYNKQGIKAKFECLTRPEWFASSSPFRCVDSWWVRVKALETSKIWNFFQSLLLWFNNLNWTLKVDGDMMQLMREKSVSVDIYFYFLAASGKSWLWA